jgi:hypothetical protein
LRVSRRRRFPDDPKDATIQRWLMSALTRFG